MLKSQRLKYHIKTIGIDQSLKNSASFEHKCKLGSRVLNFSSIQSKTKIKLTLWSWIPTLELKFILILFLFSSVIFK